jgi:uridine kinase
MDAVLEHYGRTVRPKQRELVESIKRYAHVIIPEGGHNTVALDSVVPRIDSMRREAP